MTFQHYLLLRLLGILICTVACAVGYESIIGGEKAGIHQFSYQVSLIVHRHGHYCGGGIISDQFILTAAHCVIKSDNHFHGRLMLVLAGTNDIDHTDKPAVIAHVTKIFVPKAYVPQPNNYPNDIALLKLRTPLGLSHHPHLKSLKLPKSSKSENYADKTAEIAGFGWNHIKHVKDSKKTDGYSNTHLRYAHALILSNYQCQQKFRHRKILDSQICARLNQPDDHSRPLGTCNGDSGGSLVHDETVIGILSTSPIGCIENKRPSVYTRVSNFLDFIEIAMKAEKGKNIRVIELT